MRIKQISVQKLFGVFDHTIPLNQEERITIIHGPNGYGKTVLLRMIDGFFNEDYAILHSTPFDELRLNFTDGSCLKLVPDHANPDVRVDAFFGKNGSKEKQFRLQYGQAKGEESSGQRSTLDVDIASIKFSIPAPIPDPDWLIELRNCVNAHLIKTDRLHKSLPKKKS